MRARPSRALRLLACTLLCAAPARAEVKLAGIFGDSMVLQREQPIALWGTAAPGEEITAQLAGKSAQTQAGADGRWSLDLEARPAGGPFELTVSGTNRIVLRDVQVGEVWIVAGQSNAELPLSETEDGAAEAAKSKPKRVRLFRQETVDSPTRLAELKGGPWTICTGESAPQWTALGYYFASELETALDVPIGLVQCTQSGSPAEPWVERAALEQDPELAPALARFARKAKSLPGAVFNGTLAPLAPFRMRGVVWYQGESNVKFARQYRRLFPALIEGWRKLAARGDFPFLFVQLAGFGAPAAEPGESEWAELREAQAAALALPKTAMAVAADQGDVASLHPPRKRELGHRLALLALADVYARTLECRGPVFKSFETKGGSVRVHFDHASGGLRVRGGGKPLGFALAGTDGAFHWAEATIEGETLVLQCPAVVAPVALRYSWSDNPAGNLENTAKLPAQPFRSDADRPR